MGAASLSGMKCCIGEEPDDLLIIVMHWRAGFPLRNEQK